MGVFASCVLRNICVVVLVAPNTERGGLRWQQFMNNLYLFLFCRWMRWLQPEDRAGVSPTCSATYVENTPLLLIGSLSQVSKRVLTMLILVLNLLTRIKLGRHTWCARHAPRLCVGGPMARGVWTLEFPWFWGSRQIMSLTATSALLMWLGSTERTGTASSILIFNQHVVP